MKSTTVLTNLQRGNIEAKIKTKIELTFFEKCAQGEIWNSLEITRKSSIKGKLKNCHILCSFR